MPVMIDGKERVCLDCHRRPNIQSNEGAFSSQALCFECHGQGGPKTKLGRNRGSLEGNPRILCREPPPGGGLCRLSYRRGPFAASDPGRVPNASPAIPSTGKARRMIHICG